MARLVLVALHGVHLQDRPWEALALNACLCCAESWLLDVLLPAPGAFRATFATSGCVFSVLDESFLCHQILQQRSHGLGGRDSLCIPCPICGLNCK